MLSKVARGGGLAESLTMCKQTFSCVKDAQFLQASALAKKIDSAA
jgi:hypothetical protein